MKDSHWAARTTHWSKIKQPLRPHFSSIAVQKQWIGSPIGSVIVLGVTPEFHGLFDNITAIDREAVMIEKIWPGDTDTKHTMLADWLTIELSDNFYDGVVGDGSLNMVKFPNDAATLLNKCLSWIKPGCGVAVRVFSRPEEPITIEQLKSSIHDLSWDAWRCYMKMYMAGKYGVNIPSASQLDIFNDIFPDRIALAKETGWDIEQINISMDSYKNGKMNTSFPTRSEWLSVVPKTAVDVGFDENGPYDLSDLFPVLRFRKP